MGVRVKKGRSGQAAFTLVELVVVIIILSVVAVAAYPRIQAWGTVRVHSAARKLLSDLRYAQWLSMSKAASHGVEFDPAGNRYRIFTVSNGVNIKDPYTGDEGVGGQPWNSGFVVDYTSYSGLVGVDLVSTNFEVPAVGNELRFDSMGRPKDVQSNLFGNAGQVVLWDEGLNKTLTIEPDTGWMDVQ